MDHRFIISLTETELIIKIRNLKIYQDHIRNVREYDDRADKKIKEKKIINIEGSCSNKNKIK
jgi:hypothetical protein